MKTRFWTAFAILTALLSGAKQTSAGEGWSGFHAAFDTGIASLTTTQTTPAAGGTPDFFFVEDLDPDIVVAPTVSAAPVMTGKTKTTRKTSAALSAGYDRQIGQLVLGIEGDISQMGSSNADADMDWIATARVKAGWAASEKLLVYATGGAALAGFDVTGTPEKHRKVGHVFGGGAEFKIRANWSLKGEYLHHEFSRLAIGGGSVQARIDTLKLGLAYRF